MIDGEIVIDLDAGEPIRETIDVMADRPHPNPIDGLDPVAACTLFS